MLKGKQRFLLPSILLSILLPTTSNSGTTPNSDKEALAEINRKCSILIEQTGITTALGRCKKKHFEMYKKGEPSYATNTFDEINTYFKIKPLNKAERQSREKRQKSARQNIKQYCDEVMVGILVLFLGKQDGKTHAELYKVISDSVNTGSSLVDRTNSIVLLRGLELMYDQNQKPETLLEATRKECQNTWNLVMPFRD